MYTLESLIEASKILEKAKRATSSEPMPIYLKANHACAYVDKQIGALINQ